MRSNLTENEIRICDNLNKFMKLKQKKGVDLANQLNITTASVSRIMTGESVPSINQIIIICNFLDITIYELLGIDNPYALSDEEYNIIKAIREDKLNKELVKRALNIK